MGEDRVGYFGFVQGDLTAEQKRHAYAWSLKLNARQAEAFAALLWEGKLLGTTLPDVEPPRVAAIQPLGHPEAIEGPEHKQDRKTGAWATEPYVVDGQIVEGTSRIVEEPPYPPSHTALVVAEDGRMWSITRAGITWPVPFPTNPPEDPTP